MLSNYKNYINFDEAFFDDWYWCEDAIFEVSAQAPKILKELEKILEPLCSNPKLSKNEINTIEKEINKKIKAFTGIPTKIECQTNLLNVMVFPDYNINKSNTRSKMNSLIKENNQLSNIKEIKEINPQISKINIILGLKFIRKFKIKPAELVAIFLHEIGHIYYHKKRFPGFLKKLSRALNNLGLKLSLLLGLFQVIDIFVYRTVSMVLLITSRTLSFFEHREEYGCDKVAIQFGYGQEMESVISKFSNIPRQKNRNIFLKLVDFLKRLINITSHPGGVNRACKVSKDMLEEYSNLYPDVKHIIEKRIKELKC